MCGGGQRAIEGCLGLLGRGGGFGRILSGLSNGFVGLFEFTIGRGLLVIRRGVLGEEF